MRDMMGHKSYLAPVEAREHIGQMVRRPAHVKRAHGLVLVIPQMLAIRWRQCRIVAITDRVELSRCYPGGL
jgi:hypothetical protein